MGYSLDNLRVLVVDQNQHFRQLLRTILQTVGARTIDLSDSAEAGFEKYCHHEYELVFTDADLEPQSGLYLLDLIRTSRRSPNPYVPVIMLSAHCNEEMVKIGRDQGVSEFLAKPFTVDILLNRLEAVIENPRSFVRADGYFGPDRRRKSNFDFDGLERRKLALEEVALSMQDIAVRQRAALANNKYAIDELAGEQRTTGL